MAVLIDILGVRLAVEGPASLVEELGSEYPHACVAEMDATNPDVRLIWNDLSCYVPEWKASFQVEAENLISPVTRVLLRRAMASKKPHIIFMHGNAVARAEGLLVMVGASGAGKTTLSLEMLERDGISALLAEDLLAIDAEKGELLPYPRASRVKLDGREFFRAHDRLRLSPESLAGAEVAFLRPAVAQRKAINCIVLSAWSLEARSLIGEAMPSGCLVEWVDNTPVVSFSVAPAAGRLSKLVADLDRIGILVLSSVMPMKAMPLARPDHAIVRPLAWDEVLDEAVANVVGPVSRPGGSLLLALGRAFSRSRCWSLIPGGTPAATIDALLGAPSHAA